ADTDAGEDVGRGRGDREQHHGQGGRPAEGDERPRIDVDQDGRPVVGTIPLDALGLRAVPTAAVPLGAVRVRAGRVRRVVGSTAPGGRPGNAPCLGGRLIDHEGLPYAAWLPTADPSNTA